MICFFSFPGLIFVYLLKNAMTVIVALVMFGTSIGSVLKEGLESEGLDWKAVPSVVLALIFNFAVPLCSTLVVIRYWGSLTDRSKFTIAKLLYNHDQVIYQ